MGVGTRDERYTPSVPLSLSLGKRDCEGGTVFQRQTQWDGGSTSDDDGRGCHKEKMGSHYSTGQLAAALSLPKSLTYHDISIEQISAKIDISSSSSSEQFLPLDLHMDIGEGISDVTDKSSTRARDAIRNVMDSVQSLHVHDSSSITSVAPEHTFRDPPNNE